MKYQTISIAEKKRIALVALFPLKPVGTVRVRSRFLAIVVASTREHS